ncbi:TlpA family protein disulfide reductase [Henriciella barbarensis]|uniref:TlpA family protein disulfide reductase n=1 Tax=Henriciella barbarensis TaxID=86342 RepID=A0A399QZU1_9PROT|nr:TlpA disulfide reductase family protein [Henriciella barbarensis]RIJ24081.1 TlpA family protein disulfide reductase [Henriciella barbarensis]
MSRLVRFAIPALVLVGLAGVSLTLLQATSKGGSKDEIANLATGSIAALDVSNRGEPVSTAAFDGPDGETVTLSDFEGRNILVNFWATWCGPCEREMPSLAALQTARGDEDFQVVAISIDAEEDRDYARKRLQELTGGVIDFYFVPPERWDVVYESGARGFPTTVIYDETGAEIARLAGEAAWDSYEAIALIDAIKD